MIIYPAMSDDKIEFEYSLEEVEICLKVLSSFANKSEQLTLLSNEQRIAMFKACGFISRPDPEEARKRDKDVKKLRRQRQKEENRLARKATGIRTLRDLPVFTAPTLIEFTPIKPGEEVEEERQHKS